MAIDIQIDIAKEMAACVIKMGGQVLDDELVRPDFKNADFWFPSDGVVAELKCLTEDMSSKKRVTDRISTLYTSWIKRGLMPPLTSERTQLNLRDLPQICAREFIEPIKKGLEASTVKKANRQIKETKKRLCAPTATGLLLLANDGNYMLPPTMMAYLLDRILNVQHTSIHTVIYFSANMTVSVNQDHAGPFWIEALPRNRTPVAPEFLRALRSMWMSHYSLLVPGPVYEMHYDPAPEITDTIQFIKK